VVQGPWARIKVTGHVSRPGKGWRAFLSRGCVAEGHWKRFKVAGRWSGLEGICVAVVGAVLWS